MSEHRASAIFTAPVDRVYRLFSDLTSYPSYFRHIKHVGSYDDRTMYWTVDTGEHYEWDAEKESFRTNARIGWHGTRVQSNFGEVLLEPLAPRTTRVFLRVSYERPSSDGVGQQLQRDLDRLAAVVSASGDRSVRFRRLRGKRVRAASP